MSALRWILSCVALCGTSLLACNTLLGINPPNETDDGEESNDCVLNSDCSDDGDVCLFRTCSPPCDADLDCESARRCLRTDNATACVTDVVATCAEEACPNGSSCVADVCRITCEGDEGCFSDQRCIQGACFGTDPVHDPAGEPCEPQATRCRDDGLLQTCTADEIFGEPVSCPFLCVGSTCGGECAPDTADCADGKQRIVCSEAGQWEDAEECEAVCSSGVCQESCAEDSYQCAGKKRLRCGSNGEWEEEEACEFVCDEETATCVGECAPNARNCNPDTQQLLICGSDGAWSELLDCPEFCIANPDAAGGYACGACEPGNQRCSENRAQTCSDAGTWDGGEDCTAADQTCRLDGSVAACAGECAPDEKSCDSWDAVVCAAGAFVLADDCSNPTEICRAGVCEANTPYNVGESSSTGFTNASIAAGTMLAVPITVPHDAELLKFAMQVSVGQTAVFALYADASGAPGARLAESLPVAAGGTSSSPQAAVTLQKGRKLWVTVQFASVVTFRIKSPGVGYETPATYATNPATFNVGEATAQSWVWPLYLQVRDLP